MENNDKIEKAGGKFHADLYYNYQDYHIPELNFRGIKRENIVSFIEELKKIRDFEVAKAGESVEGREINLIKIGDGPRKVLLWSQMHGDESTATRALFEIFRFFALSDALDPAKRKILTETTLLFIPMLNPDGAEVFQRHNALNIDLNRDALRLVSPEARILKNIRDQYQPEFGFNLHDQSPYYNVSGSGKTAAISFLAPPYNREREINDGRANAMKLIASMNEVLQQYIPGHVGRFDDSFEPRAFGDNIQKWGTGTVLIESGGFPGDPEKRNLVKMNFMAILHGLAEIAGGDFRNKTLDGYYDIPENDKKFFDLLIRNGEIVNNGKSYCVDIGILYNSDLAYSGNSIPGIIEEMGDLSAFYGYEELDAAGMQINSGNIYPEILQDCNEINEAKALEWLKMGYTTVRVKNITSGRHARQFPIYIIREKENELSKLCIGARANFIVRKDGGVQYAIVNGRVIGLA